MSVHKEGTKWRVKYKIAGRQRSRTFDRKGDADSFDAEVKRRRRSVRSSLASSTVGADPRRVRARWVPHPRGDARPADARTSTRGRAALKELGGEPLVGIDVPMLAAHQRVLLDRGATPSTVREVMARLSGVLQVAVEHGHIAGNPVRSLRKVPLDTADEVDPLAPVELEALIAGLSGRERAIALLAGHLGMRPLEVRRAPWDAFDGRTLTVGRARTKRSAARTRVLDVPAITARELRAWRLESGGRGRSPSSAR